MELENEYGRQVLERYKVEVEPLFRYIPWMEQKKGVRVESNYADDRLAHSVAFPVYDSTLLGFVKDVQRTALTDRNYVYVYSRNRIQGPADEHRLIAGVTIKNLDLLTGILSHYILGGMTKGRMWSEAVEEGIFLEILLKFKELFELWG